jgi:pyruvate dehydrogenase E1 component alpha subunit
MHESMNLASAWKLPVLFVLTNNTYGMSTPISRVVGDTDLAKRAIPYGMKCFECDGNDVLAVYDTVRQAREYAIENGPVLIVEHTYRTSGHSKSDGNQYRTKEEIQYWKDRNPILRFRQQLVEAGVFTDAQVDEIQAEADKIIDSTVEYAKAQPQPDLADLETDVYAD